MPLAMVKSTDPVRPTDPVRRSKVERWLATGSIQLVDFHCPWKRMGLIGRKNIGVTGTNYPEDRI